MTNLELQARLTAINDKAGKNSKPIYYNDEEYAILEKAYIALDLDKDIFAKLVFADMRAFLDNVDKWDWMIRAHEHYQEEVQYEKDRQQVDELEKSLADRKARIADYEKKRRTYSVAY